MRGIGLTHKSSEFHFDVFLSHSSKDKAVVRAVAERLRADGLRVWLDDWEVRPGDSIPAKFKEGLEHSRVLVLCMSANAFGSDWAQLEAGTCGSGNLPFRDPLNQERRFIPLGLDDCTAEKKRKLCTALLGRMCHEVLKIGDSFREKATCPATAPRSSPQDD